MDNLFMGLPGDTWTMIVIIIVIVTANVVSIARKIKKDREVM